MAHKTLLFCFLLFATNCKKQEQMPINNDKMVKILADVHLAEALADERPQLNRDSLLQAYYAQIMAQHQVTRADYDSSMMVLTKKPFLMRKLYDEVLKTMQTRIDSIQKPK